MQTFYQNCKLIPWIRVVVKLVLILSFLIEYSKYHFLFCVHCFSHYATHFYGYPPPPPSNKHTYAHKIYIRPHADTHTKYIQPHADTHTPHTPHAHAHMCTHMHMHMHTHMHMHIYTHTHTHTRACVHACTHARVYTHSKKLSVRIFIFMSQMQSLVSVLACLPLHHRVFIILYVSMIQQENA